MKKLKKKPVGPWIVGLSGVLCALVGGFLFYWSTTTDDGWITIGVTSFFCFAIAVVLLGWAIVWWLLLPRGIANQRQTET